MRPDSGWQHYWQLHTDGGGSWRTARSSDGAGPPGDELAALRRGIGREPGEVPQMWRYYTTLRQSGTVHDALRAEHLTLTLFAIHQQSKSQPVHRDGIGLGTAVHNLRGKFSGDAVDRRFGAAATATTVQELAHHLRGLLTQLRTIDGTGVDYTRLYDDLRRWQRGDGPAQVRRRWGSEYFTAMYQAEKNTKSTEGIGQ